MLVPEYFKDFREHDISFKSIYKSFVNWKLKWWPRTESDFIRHSKLFTHYCPSHMARTLVTAASLGDPLSGLAAHPFSDQGANDNSCTSSLCVHTIPVFKVV